MATLSQYENSDIKTLNKVSFSELFDINELQHIQDQFSDATGVASIITQTDGTPITRPPNFCRLCNDIIRKTGKGLKNCYRSDAIIGRHNPSGPIVQPCLSGGLFDAGASITVGVNHIANWLIGQVRNDKLVNTQMLQYAKDIGADENDFMSAFEDVPVMSEEKFGRIAEMLYTFANSISIQAFNNYQLKQSIVKINVTEAELETERNLLRTLIDTIPDWIYAKDTEGSINLESKVGSGTTFLITFPFAGNSVT
jgi:ligand-binding sensor protein